MYFFFKFWFLPGSSGIIFQIVLALNVLGESLPGSSVTVILPQQGKIHSS